MKVKSTTMILTSRIVPFFKFLSKKIALCFKNNKMTISHVTKAARPSQTICPSRFCLVKEKRIMFAAYLTKAKNIILRIKYLLRKRIRTKVRATSYSHRDQLQIERERETL